LLSNKRRIFRTIAVVGTLSALGLGTVMAAAPANAAVSGDPDLWAPAGSRAVVSVINQEQFAFPFPAYTSVTFKGDNGMTFPEQNVVWGQTSASGGSKPNWQRSGDVTLHGCKTSFDSTELTCVSVSSQEDQFPMQYVRWTPTVLIPANAKYATTYEITSTTDDSVGSVSATGSVKIKQSPMVVTSPKPGGTVSTNGATFTGTASPCFPVELRNRLDETLARTEASCETGAWSVTLPPMKPGQWQIDAVTASPTNAPPENFRWSYLFANLPRAQVTVSRPFFDGSELPKTNILFTGKAPVHAPIEITDGQGKVIGSTVANDKGIWSTTVAGPLSSGENVFTVTDTYPKGTSTNVTYTVATDDLVVTGPREGESVGKTNVVVTGTADPGQAIRIKDANGKIIGTGIANESGTWIASIPGPFTAGKNTLTVTDALGHSIPMELTVDSDAVTITEPTTGTALPKTDIAFAGSAEPGATVQLTDGNSNVLATGTADANGIWTANVAGPLPAGDTSFTVSDGTKSVSRDYTVASDPMTITSPAAGSSIEKSGATFAGTAEPGSIVQIKDADGDVIATASTDADGTWNATLEGSLPAGKNVLTITDGEHTTTAAVSVASAPTTITSPTAGSAVPKANIPFTGTAEPGATVQVRNASGQVLATGTADASGVWTATVVGPLRAGDTTFSASEVTSAAEVSVTVSADPTVITSPTAGSSIPTTDIPFAGTAEPGTTVQITDANGNVVATGVADANGDWTATIPGPLAEGGTSITLSDGTTEFTVEVAVAAAAAPTQDLLITSPKAGSTVNTSNVVVEGTATPGATVQITDAGGNVIGSATADNTGRWSATIAGPLPGGPNTLSISDGTTSVTVDYLATDDTEGTPMLNSISGVGIAGLFLGLGALGMRRPKTSGNRA